MDGDQSRTKIIVNIEFTFTDWSETQLLISVDVSSYAGCGNRQLLANSLTLEGNYMSMSCSQPFLHCPEGAKSQFIQEEQSELMPDLLLSTV